MMLQNIAICNYKFHVWTNWSGYILSAEIWFKTMYRFNVFNELERVLFSGVVIEL